MNEKFRTYETRAGFSITTHLTVYYISIMSGTGLNHTESIKDNIQMLTDLYQP